MKDIVYQCHVLLNMSSGGSLINIILIYCDIIVKAVSPYCSAGEFYPGLEVCFGKFLHMKFTENATL